MSLNLGIYRKSYKGSYYNVRYVPYLRDIGVSGFLRSPASANTLPKNLLKSCFGIGRTQTPLDLK